MKRASSTLAELTTSQVTGARTEVLFDGGTSVLISNFLSPAQAQEALDAIRQEVDYVPRDQLTYRGRPLARSKAFYGDVYQDGSQPFYKYPGKAPPLTKAWTPTLRQIRDRLTALDVAYPRCMLKQMNTQVVVNAYSQPRDRIGKHMDKTESFANGSAVMTVSLGGPRVMRVTNIQSNEHEDLVLDSGSLVVLSWSTNQTHHHEILPHVDDTAGSACPERISLTYRNIVMRKNASGMRLMVPKAQYARQTGKVPYKHCDVIPLPQDESKQIAEQSYGSGRSLWLTDVKRG